MIDSDYTNITSQDFELLVFDILKDCGSKLDNFEIIHNTFETSHDGTYQIDIKATFEAFGTKVIVLVECKKHHSPIKREVVQILKDRLQSLGVHKGIIFSTSKFQSGCVEYAKEHGIALVRVIDGKLTYSVKSHDKEIINYPPGLPKYVGQHYYDFNEYGYSEGNLSRGWTDTLLEFLKG